MDPPWRVYGIFNACIFNEIEGDSSFGEGVSRFDIINEGTD